MVSTKPNKQRRSLYNAPMHRARKQLTAKLSEDLRQQLGIARATIRTGDTVKVMRGDHSGYEGKVIAVKSKRGMVAVEGLTRKKADGTEVPIWIHASKVMITKIDLSDKARKEAIENKAEQRKQTLERVTGTGVSG